MYTVNIGIQLYTLAGESVAEWEIQSLKLVFFFRTCYATFFVVRRVKNGLEAPEINIMTNERLKELVTTSLFYKNYNTRRLFLFFLLKTIQ